MKDLMVKVGGFRVGLERRAQGEGMHEVLGTTVILDRANGLNRNSERYTRRELTFITRSCPCEAGLLPEYRVSLPSRAELNPNEEYSGIGPSRRPPFSIITRVPSGNRVRNCAWGSLTFLRLAQTPRCMTISLINERGRGKGNTILGLPLLGFYQ